MTAQLLGQPGGFERIFGLLVDLSTPDVSVLDRPEERDAQIDPGVAAPQASALDGRHHDLAITGIDEALKAW